MRYYKLTYIFLSLLFLFLCLAVGIAIGTTNIAVIDVAKIVLSHLVPFNLFNLEGVDTSLQAIVWLVRAPRVLTAAFVGASLAIAGVQMQGLFQNPLASPDVIGTSSGGALGAVIAITTGLVTRSIFSLPLLAFVGAIFCTFVTYNIATMRGKTTISILLLSGMALNTLIGAITSLIITTNWMHLEVSSEIMGWLLGSLDSRTWNHVFIVMPGFFFGLAIAFFYSKDLNIFLSGEETAISLGVDVQKVKYVSLLGAALLTSSAVAVSGLIGFVGLIVPHIVRLIIGPDHRFLIPASALTGAITLVIADLIARKIASPIEFRLGIITAIIGAPFFLFLLIKQYKENSL